MQFSHHYLPKYTYIDFLNRLHFHNLRDDKCTAMAKRKNTILPVILMVDDRSSDSLDQFILAMRKLEKDDLPEKADRKAVFEAGLLIHPVDYLPGFRRRKGKAFTTLELAEEVKALRNQLKDYETFLRKQKAREVDVQTLLTYISKR
jgi:hypothetical protein